MYWTKFSIEQALHLFWQYDIDGRMEYVKFPLPLDTVQMLAYLLNDGLSIRHLEDVAWDSYEEEFGEFTLGANGSVGIEDFLTYIDDTNLRVKVARFLAANADTYFNKRYAERIRNACTRMADVCSTTVNTNDYTYIPLQNDYKAVVNWLEREKEQGRDHYANANHNRSQMCREISKMIGWTVDSNSLGKCITRNS